MFAFKNAPSVEVFLTNKEKLMFFLSFLFSFFVLLPGGVKLQNYVFFNERKGILVYSALAILGLGLTGCSIAVITSSLFNPFIYFRF
jgi:hypothetical protein